MFGNRKLKERIETLEQHVRELNFKLERPQPYKIGEVIKDKDYKGAIVISIELDYINHRFWKHQFRWLIKAYHKKELITLYK